MGPGDLRTALSALPTVVDDRLIVGTAGFDDAGVIRLSDELALVQSVDFFTPVVDDPFDFGRIAAANALSDIYAMGALPLCALAVCGFPKGTLPLEALQRTLAGGLEVLAADNVVPLGGHTIKSPEFTYGLAVTGTVHPAEVLTNAGARPGDVLILTKPLGTGVLSTALKNGALSADAEAMLIASMAATNRQAAESCRAVGVHALTDITGYGLLGHGLEMAEASAVRLEISMAALPLLPGAREAAAAGAIPGGLIANREWAGPRTTAKNVGEIDVALACDPQTSGGLLAALPAEHSDTLLGDLESKGIHAAAVGWAVEGPAGTALLRH